MLNAFNIQLKMINILDSEKISSKFTNNDRLEAALTTFKPKDNNLKELLFKFSKIFMADTFDLGKTHVVKHFIPTEGDPILLQPRRQPIHLEQKIDELVKHLLENDY